MANKEPLNTTETTIKFPAVRAKLASFVELNSLCQCFVSLQFLFFK